MAHPFGELERAAIWRLFAPEGQSRMSTVQIEVVCILDERQRPSPERAKTRVATIDCGELTEQVRGLVARPISAVR